MKVFRKDGDYQAFIDLLSAACKRLPMRVPGYCLMPNHFHLLVWPRNDGDLSRWMQWLLEDKGGHSTLSLAPGTWDRKNAAGSIVFEFLQRFVSGSERGWAILSAC